MEKTSERPNSHCPPPPSGPYPWLLFLHGTHLRDQTFHQISHPSKSTYRKSIPELRNKTVWNCCHGWLLLSQLHQHNKMTQYSLWNPLTFESIHLPPLFLHRKRRIVSAILSSPPHRKINDLDDKVLLFDSHFPSIMFCRLGDAHWTEMNYYEEMERIGSDFLYRPVCFNARIYALTFTSSKLVVIDQAMYEPDRLVITLLSLYPGQLPRDPYLKWYLVESCGDLLAIRVIYGETQHQEVKNIIVYKHDFNHLFWHVVKTAKDRAFFVDANYAMSCPALDPNGGGLVYFVTREDRSLYTFNVDEGTVSVSLPCPHLPTPWSSPSWILPSSFGLNATQEVVCEANHEEARNKEVEEYHFLDLVPLDILNLIARRLPPIDYMYFRLICTTCCLAAPVKMMSHSYKFSGEPVSPTPWLAFCNKVVCTFIDPRVCHKYCITIQPESFCDYTISFATWIG